MYGFITDRTRENVQRRQYLADKVWARMTEEERSEWVGDPLSTVGANLIPPTPYHAYVADIQHGFLDIEVKSNITGSWLYGIVIIGNAENYENKTFTLSVDGVSSTNTHPKIAVYWHDENGYEWIAEGFVETNGMSITFDTTDHPNTGGRAYLALYLYITTDVNVSVGDTVRFEKVMLEIGDERHPYVPYTEIVPTACTKGAYNYSDLNRIGRAIVELIGTTEIKTDWNMKNIPTTADMSLYLEKISLINSAYSLHLPLPSSMNNLTYQDANNIEKVLLAVYEKKESIVSLEETE